MTHEDEKPDAISPPAAKPATRENIFLNWVLTIVAFGAITLAANYLPIFL